jgi:outer membrane protein assembly factor BamB
MICSNARVCVSTALGSPACSARLFHVGFSIFIALIGTCSAINAAESSTSDWPNWSGPQYNLISQETGFAAQWPKGGLKPLWTREIGTGFSSMSVADNRLFTMGHVDGNEHVWCLNPETGAVLWEHKYPCQLLPNLHEGGPCATPTVHGDSVYTVGKEGQLFCLNVADGTVRWKIALQEDLGVKLPEWGFSSSPRILGDQLILEGGRVVSYDRTTGKKNWQTEVHTAGYGSAAVMKQGEQTLLVTLDCDSVRVLNAVDGTEVAVHEWKSPYQTNSTTPIVLDDRIFISTGYDVGCTLLKLNGSQLTEVYRHKEMRNHFNNSVLYQGHIYGFDGNSHNSRSVTVACLNAETGKVAWRQRNLGCGSLMIVDNKLLILSEKGDLVLAEASSAGYHELARTKFLDGRCWTVPVVSHGRVYGRNADGKLVCVQLPRS